MSREYMVLVVEQDQNGEVDHQPARVFMRFTEPPSNDFLNRLAAQNNGKRVYCLMGASTWYGS